MAATMKPRPTTYNGIVMRSRLEAGFAAWLDRWGFDWEYEPCAFASKDGQYLPDFLVKNLRCSWLPGPVPAVIEVKPKGWDARHKDHEDGCPGSPCGCAYAWLGARFDIVAQSIPDAVFLLAEPRTADCEYPELNNVATVFSCEYDDIVKQRWPLYRRWAIGAAGEPMLHGSNCECAGVDHLILEHGPWQGDWWEPDGS